jgi:hypothetical protein
MTPFLILTRAAIIGWTTLAVFPLEIAFDVVEANWSGEVSSHKPRADGDCGCTTTISPPSRDSRPPARAAFFFEPLACVASRCFVPADCELLHAPLLLTTL